MTSPEHDGRFLPVPTPETQPFWDGCLAGELRIQQCPACGHHQFYPRQFCTACGHAEPAWQVASGRGEVVSFTVVRHPVSQAYAAEVPYVLALIRLAEGPQMMSTLVDCLPEQVSIGAPVTVLFERCNEQIAIARFRLVSRD
jgi:uncharacterized OB-fold protein